MGFDHLLDKADALPTALDERKQKNALARKSTLEFLRRCVERREEAGPRGGLTGSAAEKVVKLASSKLQDSDAQPRKAAMDILQALQGIEDEEVAVVVRDVVAELKTDNPRAYKALTAMGPGSSISTKSSSRAAGVKKADGTSSSSSKSSATAPQRPGTASSSRSLSKRSVASSARRPPKEAKASASVVAHCIIDGAGRS